MEQTNGFWGDVDHDVEAAVNAQAAANKEQETENQSTLATEETEVQAAPVTQDAPAAGVAPVEPYAPAQQAAPALETPPEPVEIAAEEEEKPINHLAVDTDPALLAKVPTWNDVQNKLSGMPPAEEMSPADEVKLELAEEAEQEREQARKDLFQHTAEDAVANGVPGDVAPEPDNTLAVASALRGAVSESNEGALDPDELIPVVRTAIDALTELENRLLQSLAPPAPHVPTPGDQAH